MPLRHLTRLLVAAIIAAGAAPAFAQVDLSADLSLEGDSSLATKGVSMGKSETYLLAVTNNGVEPVTQFQVDPTFDTAFTQAGKPQPKVVSGCTPNDPAGLVQFPCTWRGIIYGTQEADIEISFTYPAPMNGTDADGKPIYDPTKDTCPNADATVSTGDVTFTSSATISKFNGSDTVTNAGTSTASKTSVLRNLADLQVVSVTNDVGGGDVNQGATHTYTTIVKNNGPCPAPAVRVQWGGATSMTYVDGSVSLTTCGTDTSMKDLNRCKLVTDPLPKGSQETVTSQWSVGSYPSSTRSASATMEVTASSRATGTTLANTDDPVGNNSSNSIANGVSGLASSGCSTGGATGILSGLLALAGVRLARRRSRA